MTKNDQANNPKKIELCLSITLLTVSVTKYEEQYLKVDDKKKTHCLNLTNP